MAREREYFQTVQTIILSWAFGNMADVVPLKCSVSGIATEQARKVIAWHSKLQEGSLMAGSGSKKMLNHKVENSPKTFIDINESQDKR